MDIGIGLPSTIPGIPGRLILDWARAAEQAGFSSLGTLDRIVYGNLGEYRVEHAQRYLGDYYSFVGDFAGQIAAGALTSPQQVADTVARFTDAGCDELILFPCNPDVRQVSLTAGAAGL